MRWTDATYSPIRPETIRDLEIQGAEWQTIRQELRLAGQPLKLCFQALGTVGPGCVTPINEAELQSRRLDVTWAGGSLFT